MNGRASSSSVVQPRVRWNAGLMRLKKPSVPAIQSRSRDRLKSFSRSDGMISSSLSHSGQKRPVVNLHNTAVRPKHQERERGTPGGDRPRQLRQFEKDKFYSFPFDNLEARHYCKETL